MKKKKKSIPPCPGNPEDYTFHSTRDGGHWQRKRGTVTVAKLNTAFKNNVKLTSLVSPAASLIKKKLMPFLEWLDTGRFVANVSGLLKKEYNKSGKLDFLALKDYDLQPYSHLEKLFRGTYEVQVKKTEVMIEIPLRESIVKGANKQITGYYFDGILLYGDITKPNTLRTDSESSPVYDMRLKTNTTCRLSLILPSKKVSWMVLLKLNCVFKNEGGSHRSHYGMKVVWAERP